MGDFNDIRVEDQARNFREWESRNEKLLRRFQATVQQLIQSIKRQNCHKVEVRRIGTGALQIREPTENPWSALPQGLVEKWKGPPVAAEGGRKPDTNEKRSSDLDEERDRDNNLNS